ncbi:ATP-dependent DNA ligase [Arthrobacter sp. efr-133-TYG-118]|uniref:ATP-dependent DNA ligase n=1 Tax=Arthrobacter sp. efr-133-TYG-118 TaxID=3040279 RepID=UPI00254D3555|nr:ATP-dependent DNA ligase [Arthrobacter sp. efr-133-TYG-118]
MSAGHSRALGGPFDLALAKAVPTIPDRPQMLFEPKFDGFRTGTVIEDGRVRIWSRNGTDLTSRLPELEQAVAEQVDEGFVLDGEAVIWNGEQFDFDALQRRMGAGAALARRLAARQPASLVVFDVLAVLGRDVRSLPLADRRRLLEELATDFAPPLQLSPATHDRAVAVQWWDDLAHTGVEGVMAKRLDEPCRGGVRAWFKVKRRDTTEAVVAAVIGSCSRPTMLVLGLHDDSGRLRFAGRTGSLSSDQAAKAAGFLRPPAGEHPWPEEVPSTWLDRFAKEKRLVHLTLVEPVVVEISADAARSGLAFRHSVRLVRFRPELDPGDVRSV